MTRWRRMIALCRYSVMSNCAPLPGSWRKTARANVTIDWTVRENVRANLRVLVKRLLRRYGYPPDKQEQARQTVLEQAELREKRAGGVNGREASIFLHAIGCIRSEFLLLATGHTQNARRLLNKGGGSVVFHHPEITISILEPRKHVAR
jgi:hypothetical protein